MSVLHHVHGLIAHSGASTHAHRRLMAREAQPLPNGPDDPNHYGVLADFVGPAAEFTHGLNGVNQPLNYKLSAILGFAMAAMIAVTLLFRWAKLGDLHMRYLLTHGGTGSQRYWAKNRTSWWPWIKQHLLYAPLFRVRHNRELQLSSAVSVGTLPGRFHFLLLSVYVWSNVAYDFILSYDAGKAAAVADLRGRSGVLAIINLIPTVLFALRNNPLIHMTRVSYDTFNLFHRWCARMVVFHSIVHTVAYGINTIDAGGKDAIAQSIMSSTSYMWGLVATCLMTLIVILALSPLRHAFYETFLSSHKILVLLSIIGVWIHLDTARLDFLLPYLRVVFALWGGEYIVRFYRIAYHNISFRSGNTRVIVEALPAEACRVTFELSRPWHFKPGCHVHAYLPALSWWSSHPFSVAWSETTAKVSSVELDVEKSGPYTMSSPLPGKTDAGLEPKMITTEVDIREVPRRDAKTSVSLIVRARTGMTRQLYNRAAKSPTGTIVLRGAIEGPYGGHEPLTSYGTVILFAGGVGVTHAMSYMKQLLTDYADGTTSCRRILFVWSVPNTEALEWVRPWMDQILRMEGRKDILRIQLFVTKPRHQGEIRSNTGTVQMFPGRCNPSTIIEKEMQDRIGAMGITVCGPGAFSDGVRAAVRAHVQAGSVDFIEEAFTY